MKTKKYLLIVLLSTFLASAGFAQSKKTPTITKTFDLNVWEILLKICNNATWTKIRLLCKTLYHLSNKPGNKNLFERLYVICSLLAYCNKLMTLYEQRQGILNNPGTCTTVLSLYLQQYNVRTHQVFHFFGPRVGKTVQLGFQCNKGAIFGFEPIW